MNKCKNCGEEITQKTHDTFGRRITRKKIFCGQKCRFDYFKKQHSDYFKNYWLAHKEAKKK